MMRGSALGSGRSRLLCCLLWLACGLSVCAAAAAASEDDIVIIAAPDVAVAELTQNGLRYIYSLRLRNWPDGGRIRVYALADEDAIHGQFCREVLGTYPATLRLAWDRVAYTGIASPAVQVGSEAAMVAAIAKTPQSIGYARRRAATPEVKILPVTRDR